MRIFLVGRDVQLLAPAHIGPHLQGKGSVAAPELIVPDNAAAQAQPGMLEYDGAVLVQQVAAGGDVQLEGFGWNDLVAFDTEKYQPIIDARNAAK